MTDADRSRPRDPLVCLCFHVPQGKIVRFCRRERPPVASLISECLSAGTGCGWCVPFIRKLHAQVMAGDPDPRLEVDPETYARQRDAYRKSGRRDA